jgi:hypothetical protein
MLVFLTIFSLFNLCVGGMSAGLAVRLGKPDVRARWASKRLYAIAGVMTGTLPLVAIVGTAVAWALVARGWEPGGLYVLAPIVFLIVMGVVFAIVDISEDGVLDFGRGPKRKS